MQLTFIQSYSDQLIADRMRVVAQKMHASDHFVEMAVDEAVMAYRATGCEATAINAGVESLHAVFQAGNDGCAADAEDPQPLAWVENGYVIAGLLVLALFTLLVEARVFE